MESPKKRLKWSNEQMVAAINAVSKGCSISRAAREYGIPRTTLKYLVQYVSPRPAKKSTSTRVMGSRVLTSVEGLAILREKEDKKKREKKKKKEARKA